MKEYRINLNIIILFIILIIVSILISPSIKYVRFAAKADEGYYLSYANFIADNGAGRFRDLFTGYIGNKGHWVYPNPLRIGFIFLSSLAVSLFGNSFFALAYLSFFSYLLFIVLTYYFCSRLFDRQKAILLAFLVAFSPINMAMSRRALADSVTILFLGLSIWLFLDMVYKDKSFFKKLAFSLAFSYAILVKETSVFLIVPFFIYIAIYRTRLKEGFKLSDLFYILILPVSIVGSVYILLSGDLFNIPKVIKIVLASPGTNPFAVQYGSGPWFRYIIDYMLLSPWTVILSIGYVLYLLGNFGKSDAREIYFLVILLGTFFLFDLFTKNIRYVMVLDTPIRLFSILMLYQLIVIKTNRARIAVIGALILLICITDFITYKHIFVEKGVYDPMSFWLLRARSIIPWR